MTTTTTTTDRQTFGPFAPLGPVTGDWLYALPALRGEALLHRVGGYRVDDQERELRVDAACGLSLTMGAAVHVTAPGDADPLCRRCSPGARPVHRGRPGRAGRPRPSVSQAGQGSSHR